MLGSYSTDGDRNNQGKNELNLDSGSSRQQQSSDVLGKISGLSLMFLMGKVVK